MRNLEEYNPEIEPLADVLGYYFGGGMGSVVFRTIRESKALAYSSGSFIATPEEKNKPFQILSFVGTQADKLTDAIESMNELHNDPLPESNMKFETTIAALKNGIETERILPSAMIDTYKRAQKKGLNYDIRKANYAKYDEISFEDIKAFHHKIYSKKPFTYGIVASKKLINVAGLKKYGNVKELTLEEIFGY